MESQMNEIKAMHMQVKKSFRRISKQVNELNFKLKRWDLEREYEREYEEFVREIHERNYASIFDSAEFCEQGENELPSPDFCQHCGWCCEYPECHILFCGGECPIMKAKYIIYRDEDGELCWE